MTDDRSRRLDTIRWTLFAVGLAFSLVMAWRAQVGMDQYALLVRGWLLATDGWLVPFGVHMSAQGFQPGPASSVLAGLPLLAWEDFRAVNLSIVLMHVLAYWLLDRALRDTLGPRGRLLLCLLYWLNPWRVYFSAHVWNPNWLFLPAALHLATAKAMRPGPRFLTTFAHVVLVGLVFQLHASFLILALASVFLWARGYVRVSWPGVAAGTAVVLASLVPWVLQAAARPEIMPMQEGFVGRGLANGYPFVKGLGYLLRYPVAAYTEVMTGFDFRPLLGAEANAVLAPGVGLLLRTVGPLAVVASLLAHAWFWRRRPDLRFARVDASLPFREWLPGYARWMLLGAAASFALSPTTVMSWQGFIAMHAAVIPMILWLRTLWRSRAGRPVRIGLALHTAVVLVALVSMSFAAPMYRKRGRPSHGLEVQSIHPMLERLGITDRCRVRERPDGLEAGLLAGRDAWTVPANGRM